jgi:hypothetical protein
LNSELYAVGLDGDGLKCGEFTEGADYDSNGRFDAAVFRPSNSTWYLNRSTSGTQILSFGVSGDQPVPSAFVP